MSNGTQERAMESARRYFGDWSDWSEMEKSWRGERWNYDENEKPVEGMATDAEVLFAAYTYENYSGTAIVIFERDGKLYENHGGHCSCYGLEGQWSPEETTWEAIAMRPVVADADDESAWSYADDYTREGRAALVALVRSHVPASAQ